ncbi:MAG TPA: family 10 glycosylhydrolase [Verrucomicrobiae bacterium]|jgi:uncharacterized lipoprotein YddW (UPF0748 family)|nr:family 10 glycosylhydrolase [Verrucomicrobiae bacterium]
MNRACAFLVLLGFCARLCGAEETPPAPLREFRGLWVATVNNVDWPSKSGLSTRDQQAEMVALLDRAVALHLNAIILQVRPDCDALYASLIEPWSEYLTGVMGRAPFPYYDPLEFAVREAHKRGLELHAWFNPYRVRSLDMKTPVSKDFVSRRHPGIVRHYGKYLWLDPTEEETRAYSLSVVVDVVRRYDIDGVHFDDYFYPYREKANDKEIEFPDGASWARYQASGGKLTRSDWRRDNINEFVQQVSLSIKAEKPWVKFGISPFGIWRPQHPTQIKGFDAFEGLFADSRKWWTSGWVDYLTPQLYWPVDSKEQNFAALLKWWAAENVHQRHLWPGMMISGWRTLTNGEAREVSREIIATRQQAGATGNVLWHAKPLLQNHAGVGDALAQTIYAQPALVPASPWLTNVAPPLPALIVKPNKNGLKLKWKAGGDYDPWQWVLEKKIGEHWVTEIYSGDVRDISFVVPEEALRPTAFALAAVDRCGNLSAWAFPNETPSARAANP